MQTQLDNIHQILNKMWKNRYVINEDLSEDEDPEYVENELERYLSSIYD